MFPKYHQDFLFILQIGWRCLNKTHSSLKYLVTEHTHAQRVQSARDTGPVFLSASQDRSTPQHPLWKGKKQTLRYGKCQRCQPGHIQYACNFRNQISIRLRSGALILLGLFAWKKHCSCQSSSCKKEACKQSFPLNSIWYFLRRHSHGAYYILVRGFWRWSWLQFFPRQQGTAERLVVFKVNNLYSFYMQK